MRDAASRCDEARLCAPEDLIPFFGVRTAVDMCGCNARFDKRFADGDVKVVTNCQILTEGYDRPNVSCIVLARPTKSHGLFRQMVGGGLRPAKDKTDCFTMAASASLLIEIKRGLADASGRESSSLARFSLGRKADPA
jgi:hypothetical protein